MDLYARRAGGDLAAYAGPRGPHLLARANAHAPLVAYTPIFWAPYVAAGGPPPAGTTGDLAVTLADMTLASTATLTITAACSLTLADMTLASAASLVIQAACSTTLDSLTLLSSATPTIQASVSATLGSLTLSSIAGYIFAEANIELGSLTLDSVASPPVLPEVTVNVPRKNRRDYGFNG